MRCKLFQIFSIKLQTLQNLYIVWILATLGLANSFLMQLDHGVIPRSRTTIIPCGNEFAISIPRVTFDMQPMASLMSPLSDNPLSTP